MSEGFFYLKLGGKVEGPYTIGQLAHAVSVPTSTIRYYERARLLRPDGRTSGNYRVYGDATLERLRFIRAAQANGFTLDDISALLSFRGGATGRCKEVQGLIRDRLADLRTRMDQMREVEAVLRSSLSMCRQFARTGRCQVIDSLKRASTSSPPKKPRRRFSK
jgi:MerR family mercuric resistance operon transcriptional regulator